MKSWAQGSIAGVSLFVAGDPSRCTILDGASLQPRRFVNQRRASDGSVYQQGFDTAGAGAQFGVRFEQLSVDIFRRIIDAVNSALDANEPFPVALEDDVHSVDADCKADFSRGENWLSYPEQRTNDQFILNVTMRFITV